MGDCSLFYDEIRLDVRQTGTTTLYVFIRGEGDCPFQVLGWHAKGFPSSMTSIEILERWGKGEEDPMLWPRRNPPETTLNYELPDLESMLAVPRPVLWAIHIPGPDDLHAAPSLAQAEAAAAAHNAAIREWYASRPTPNFLPSLESALAVVVPWPYSREGHAEDVQEWVTVPEGESHA